MMHTIPFLDMKAQYLELKPDLDSAYQRVMDSGRYILGDEVQAFEQEFAEFVGVKHCVGVGNGLEALELILTAAGIEEGDEVIVPANTYIASWLAVSNVGAIPVPVEPDPHTSNIDPGRIRDAVSKRTKAILAVHLYGQTVEMEEIWDVAEQFDLSIIEDSAQTHGAVYKDRMAGNLGLAAGFSFYPTKNLGAFGDAGAITTNNDDLADKVRVLRNYGSRQKYFNETRGHNSRLDPLQAAFLQVKLKYIENWNARRKRIAEYYSANLNNVSELQLPRTAQHADHVWHLYVVRCRERDGLQAHLRECGIDTMIHYPVPPHLSQAYADLNYVAGAFPITEELSRSILSIPIGPHLSIDDAEFVVEKIKQFYTGRSS
jgi:dTDP-4-amino-4,6-dideoxygalactose transaminase